MADILDKDLVGIVGSIFATSPEAMKIARERADLTRAQAIASAEAQQMGGGTALSANLMGGQAVRQLGGLLGVEDPMMQRESAKRQLAQGLDMSSPEAVMEYANRLNNAGLSQEAGQAMMAARAMQEQQQRIATSRAQQIRAEREPGQVNFQQLLSSGKYTPASVAKFKQSENPADLVLAKGVEGGEGATGAGVAGPVGKAGAYRDAFGQIYGGSEMKAVRQEFDTNEKLLTMLNKVTVDDVAKAESIIDWTTKEGVVKGAGSKLASDTVTAQTKIAASQLLKQIESLPPGSASNADMVAAMKDFPGYGSQSSLAAWINRTKETIQNNLNRQVEQFGFRSRVQATPALEVGTAKPQQKNKQGSSRDNPIKLD